MASGRRRKIKGLLRDVLRAARRTAGSGAHGAPPAEDCEVTFVHEDGTESTASDLAHGTTLLLAAKRADVQLDSFCGGQCSCGTCRVNIVAGAENLCAIAGPEEMTLGASGMAKQQRLACQATVTGKVRVQIPRWF